MSSGGACTQWIPSALGAAFFITGCQHALTVKRFCQYRRTGVVAAQPISVGLVVPARLVDSRRRIGAEGKTLTQHLGDLDLTSLRRKPTRMVTARMAIGRTGIAACGRWPRKVGRWPTIRSIRERVRRTTFAGWTAKQIRVSERASADSKNGRGKEEEFQSGAAIKGAGGTALVM